MLLIIEERKDATIWATARCTKCLKDNGWVPIVNVSELAERGEK
ncbi:MAG TPA: hypothetical protein VJL31_13095 [Gemmatimonadales bacterium]|nr:hypothetical protein [Gemmatimonadales bacterium]